MKCPNCNEFVHAVDTLESEWFDNKYYDCVEGTCPKCGKIWNWIEVYSFDHIENIEEINPNDHL